MPDRGIGRTIRYIQRFASIRRVHYDKMVTYLVAIVCYSIADDFSRHPHLAVTPSVLPNWRLDRWGSMPTASPVIT